MPVTDIQIDELLINGGERMADTAFEQIYEAHKDSIFNHLLYLTGEQNRAEDLYQDCMVKIYKHLKRQTDVRSMKAWIYTIVRNTYLDYQRKQARLGRLFKWHDRYLHEVNESDDIPDDKIEKQEVRHNLMRVINELPADQREIIVMHYIWELSFREISEQLNLSINTVAARARYGLKKIRLAMGELI